MILPFRALSNLLKGDVTTYSTTTCCILSSMNHTISAYDQIFSNRRDSNTPVLVNSCESASTHRAHTSDTKICGESNVGNAMNTHRFLTLDGTCYTLRSCLIISYVQITSVQRNNQLLPGDQTRSGSVKHCGLRV